MTRRRKSFLKTALVMAGVLIAGALFKNKVLGWVKKVPGLGNIDQKIGEQANS